MPEHRDKDMTVREAGHKGGEATKETHGHEFYEEIGRKGGKVGGEKVRELIEQGKEAEREKR
jgi:general stress protein YciG